jgi:hypothetical protein
MPNESQDKNKEEIATLLGNDVTVTFDDGTPPETVTVKKVSLRLMSRFAQVITSDEATEIAFYTGKGPDWAERLSEESIEQVLDVGRTLNRKRYENFALRATRFDESMRQSPALAALVEKAERALGMASRSPGASNT